MTMRAPSAVRDLWKVVLAWGALTLILGILILAKPGTSILVAGALLGAYLVTSGIAEIALALVLDASASSRIPLFITGGLSLALGVLTFRHFGYAYAVLLLALWIAVAFVFQGVSEIAARQQRIRMKWRRKRLGKPGAASSRSAVTSS